MGSEQDVRPRRGRAKDRSKDAAVLDATIRLLASEGLTGLSMDRVAAVSWGSKYELIGAALTHLQVEHVPQPTGSVREDLIAHLRAMRRQYDESGGMPIIGSCLVDEPGSGELLARIRQSTLLPRREHFVKVLQAGVERGEIRPEVDLERSTSLVIGSLYADHLAGRPMVPGWEESVVDAVLEGLRP